MTGDTALRGCEEILDCEGRTLLHALEEYCIEDAYYIAGSGSFLLSRLSPARWRGSRFAEWFLLAARAENDLENKEDSSIPTTNSATTHNNRIGIAVYKERDSIPGGSQLISGLSIHCGQARKISKLSKTFLPLMAKRKIIEVKQWMQYSTSFTVAGKLIIVEIPISPE